MRRVFLLRMDLTMSKQRLDSAPNQSQRGVVEIVVPSYRKPYSANDFTNPQARSLDSSITHYLSTAALRTPWASPCKLIFQIAEETKDPEKEAITIEAYRAMFQWRAGAALRKFVRQLPLVVFLVCLGLALLWLSHRIDDFHWDEELKKTVAEAVRLGAWVACWSALSLLFSTGFESVLDVRAFRRLSRIPIEFEYPRLPVSVARSKAKLSSR
jgi:hypothetical protein